MTPCPNCGATDAAVQITTSSIDRDCDTSEPVLYVDQGVIEKPDSVLVEAICRNCGHETTVPDNEWEWA